MIRRNTIQRELVFNTIINLGNHPTADEIYDKICDNHPNLGRATVYRNLGILLEEGHIRKIEIPGRADRFDHQTDIHCHALCKRCKKIFDIDTVSLPDLTNNITNSYGFNIEGCDILFKGVCTECRSDSTNN